MRFWLVAFVVAATASAVAAPKDEIPAADKAFSAMSMAKGAHAAFLAYMTDDVRLFDGDHPSAKMLSPPIMRPRKRPIPATRISGWNGTRFKPKPQPTVGSASRAAPGFSPHPHPTEQPSNGRAITSRRGGGGAMVPPNSVSTSAAPTGTEGYP
jgi:hypothetical protein